MTGQEIHHEKRDGLELGSNQKTKRPCFKAVGFLVFSKLHRFLTKRIIEIPTWLNTLADQTHINLPDTLQTAIIRSVIPL
ncbi:MAG: hypothetical protein FWG02_10425 [Holophagaceae bacterium]|nr:hypothetical protein [Holophagaceae bacterium]